MRETNKIIRGKTPVLLLVLLGLAGCQKQIAVRPYDPEASLEGNPPRGIAYNIPQTSLHFTLNYELQQIKRYDVDSSGQPIIKDENQRFDPQKPCNFIFKNMSEISTTKQQTQGLWFTVDPKSVERFFVSIKEGQIQLDENGCLTAINAQFDDKSSDIVRSVVQTAFSLAKIAAVRGEAQVDVPKTIKEFSYSIVLTAEDFKLTPEGVWEWNFPQTHKLNQSSGENIVPEEAQPEEESAGGIPLDNPDLMFDEEKQHYERVDHLKIRLYPLAAAPDSISSIDSRQLLEPTEKSFNGIVVGMPGDVKLEVIVGGEVYQYAYISMMPLGGLTRIPFGPKAFSDRTTGLGFNKASGALSKYTFSSSSVGEGLSKTLEETTTEALKQTRTMETELLQNEINLLGKRGDLLAARKKYLDQLKEYEEFINKLKSQKNSNNNGN